MSDEADTSARRRRPANPFPTKAEIEAQKLQQDKTQPQEDFVSGQDPNAKPADQATEQPHTDQATSEQPHTETATSESAPHTETTTSESAQKETDQATNQATQHRHATAATKAAKRGDVGYQLRPGDVGYAPPARTAHETGLLTNDHLGYNPGRDASVNVHGQIPLAMPAPAPATIASDTSFLKPSLLDKGSATVQMSKLVGNLKAWILDNPHDTFGELAVVSQFFRDLAARQAALGTAFQLGRSVEPDAVDTAKTTPPPEYFQLRDLAQQAGLMQQIYQGMVDRGGLELTDADKAKIDEIMGRIAPLLEGPTEPPAEGPGGPSEDPPAPPPPNPSVPATEQVA